MNILTKVFGDPNKQYLKKLQAIVHKINALEPAHGVLTVEELRQKTEEMKQRLVKGETLDDLLVEGFALVREAAKRTLCQRHFDVQLLGGIVLHQGKIAEMKTGEGKTLAATLPAYLNALAAGGVHIVTVNDYLAKRDAVWMGQIYDLLGLSVGCIVHEAAFLYDPTIQSSTSKDSERDVVGGFKVVESFLRPCQRKEAYLADITYGTNNEFGFDYLKDNMAFTVNEQVQRDFNFAIIDEIDSILIDEARTPLIISAPDIESSKWYKEFSRIVPRLDPKTDYEIDEKTRTVALSESGIVKIEKILGVNNIYQAKGIKYLHHLEQALRAQAIKPSDGKPLFNRDQHYVVREGKVIIVDEFTGRLMPGRRWSGGLHQAIEAKEGVPLQPESRTLATITFQNYFRLYKKLAGMTGTALTSAEEFDKVYVLDVLAVPTNEPMVRQDLPDKVFKTENGKCRAIVKEIKTRHEKGQPILVGTTSIEKNEYLAALLQREGITPQILNAKHHEREGEIIAQAGKLGKVTVATNMAGRGVDIVFGGNPQDEEEAKKVKDLGGLHVIGAQRHEARRIDNQLRGRAGRQGDPGSSQFFISLEDDLLRIFGGERVKSLMGFLKIPEDEPIEAKIISNVIEKAQEMVEGLNFDMRKHILEYDDVIAKHRGRIYAKRKEFLKMDYQQLLDFVLGIIKKELEKIVRVFQEPEMNLKEIFEEVKTIFLVAPQVLEEMKKAQDAQQLIDYLHRLAEIALKQKQEKEGKENMENVLRFICQHTIDIFWINHLETMEELKDSVRLRAYGGRDPLVEYKTEGHKIFQQLESSINSQIAHTCFKLTVKPTAET